MSVSDCGTPEPQPPVAEFAGDGLEQPFDRAGLVSLRAAVAAHGAAFGLPGDRVIDVVLVAHELATNVVRHGGGSGRLRMWRSAASVLCEVADSGPGFAFTPPDPGRLPALAATGGRGLWMAAKLTDRMWVESTDAGTLIRVELRLSSGP